MNFDYLGKTYKGAFDAGEYANGAAYVGLAAWNDGTEDDCPGYWEPFADLSINLPESVFLPEGEFVAKTYSENAGLCEQFIRRGYFEDTGRTAAAGMAGPQPILRVTEKFRRNIAETLAVTEYGVTLAPLSEPPPPIGGK